MCEAEGGEVEVAVGCECQRLGYEARAVIVTLPWPAKPLHPNFRSRSHWPKTRATKQAREDAYWLTKIAMRVQDIEPIWAGELVEVRTTFHPPSAHKHDSDNLVASAKSLYDGIADALKIDDSLFDHLAPIIAEPTKGGKVVVEIS